MYYILYRNIKNVFFNKFGGLITLLSVLFCLVFHGESLFNYCMVKLSKSNIYWWIFNYQLTPYSPTIQNGIVKFSFICLQIFTISIINLPTFILSIDYYNHELELYIIIPIMQNILLLYGYVKLMIILTIILPLSMWLDIKKLRLFRIIGFHVSIYALLTTIHYIFNNYYPIRNLLESKYEHEKNEYLVTTAVCGMFSMWLLCGVVLIGFYIFIFFAYWYLYCLNLFTETKTIEINKLDPILPCPFDGYDIMSYEVSLIENETVTKKKIFYVMSKWCLYRTIASFTTTGIFFIPVLILVSWRVGLLFLITFPTIVEFMVKLYHVSVNTLSAMISKHKLEHVDT